MKIKCLYIIFGFMTLASCKEAKVNDVLPTIPIQNEKKVLTIQKDENKNRAVWQKPEKVVSLMGDLSDKIVADIGAGTGYFTFRIALKAKKVLAIDIVKNYLDILENLKQKLPSGYQDKIETRLATEDNPLLGDEEVEIVVIINTFSFIENKSHYLKTVKKGLKPNGKLFIVDFKMKNLPIEAPEKAQRLPMFELENLLEKAGYHNVQSDDRTLDYQYIVTAEK